MNGVRFKDTLCYQCLPGTVVASWFLTQEIIGSNTPFLHEFSVNAADSLEFIQEF